MPRVLSSLGAMMMHGACIETPHGPIAVFAESGSGKSTLSYALQDQGCRVLSDDCIKIVLDKGRCQAIPTYPSLRLWPDVVAGLSVDAEGSIPVAGYNDKRRIDVTRRDQVDAEIGPRDLQLGIILDRSTSPQQGDVLLVRLREFGKRAALMELLRQTFHLDVRDRQCQRQTFARLETFVRTLPFYGLAYPRKLEQMPAVARELLRELSERITAC